MNIYSRGSNSTMAALFLSVLQLYVADIQKSNYLDGMMQSLLLQFS